MTTKHGPARQTARSGGELVDQLEALGYVERQPDPIDRRAQRIYRTERAIKASESTVDAARRIDAELKRLLGADRLDAVKLDLARIIESRGGTVLELPQPVPGRADRTARDASQS